MAFLTLTDNNNHSLLVNLDLINMVQYDQGTLFIYYSVDDLGPVRVTDPIQQAILTNALVADTSYFDARESGNGFFINMASVKFTDLNQGTLFVHFFGNSGPKNSCRLTSPLIIQELTAALDAFISANGSGLEAVYSLDQDITVPVNSCYILCEPLQTNGHTITLSSGAVLGIIM